MSSELLDALLPLLRRVEVHLPDDPALRRELAALAHAVGNWLDHSAPPPPVPLPVPEPEVVALVAEPPPPPSRPVLPPLQPRFLDLPSTPSAETYDRDSESFDLAPLPDFISRCRLKADAARLVARRLAGIPTDPTEEGQLYQRAAELDNCYLWVTAQAPSVGDHRIWDTLAGTFDTAAAMGELLTQHEHAPTDLAERTAEEVFSLAAETQSVLLYAVADTQTVRRDFEQVQLYIRTIEATRRLRLYIPRYLKREHRTDPTTWPSVMQRIQDVSSRHRSVGDRDRVRKRILNNLKFKLTRLREDLNGHADDWPRVAELLNEAAAAGVPPSNAELREWLLPVLDDMPEELPFTPAAELIFREIDRYLAERPATTQTETEAPNPEVQAVTRLLRGREVVLIGGLTRPDRRMALIRAFGLSDLNWLTSPEHSSVTLFEAPIARPEVAVVVLATRWISHDYQNVKDYCDKYGKVFVKLPAGYHPNQVAHQILKQAGDRLRAETG